MVTTDTKEDTNPYPGPAPYERGDQRVYAGRREESQELLSLLISKGIVLFHALSGIGKTSLVNKRLIVELEAKGYHVFPVARVYASIGSDLANDPTVNPFALSVLSKLTPLTSLEALARIKLSQWLGDWRLEHPAKRAVLILDSFEELLTCFGRQFAKRDDFFLELGAALEHDNRLLVLLVAKEEYAARLEQGKRFLPDRRLGVYSIAPLSHTEALAAVNEPLLAAYPALTFAPGAAERLVSDVAQISSEEADGIAATTLPGEFVEPLILQVVCHQTWSKMRSDAPARQTITQDDVFDPGDALRGFYDSAISQIVDNTVIRELGISELAIRRWIGTTLIRGDRFRSQVLRTSTSTEGMRNEVVDLLEKHHLVREQRERGGRWYELVHDRFISPILRSNEDSSPARLSQIRNDALAWERAGGRRNRFLYTGEALKEAKSAIEGIYPDDLIRNFIRQADLVEEDRRILLRRVSILLVISTVILVVGSLWMWLYYNQQQRNSNVQTLAMTSLESIETDPERSLLYAAKAVALNKASTTSLEIKAAINSSLEGIRSELVLDERLRRADVHATSSPMDEVRFVRFLSGGRELATWDLNGSLNTWDAFTGQLLTSSLAGEVGRRMQIGTLGTPIALSLTSVATAGDSGGVEVTFFSPARHLSISSSRRIVHALAYSNDGTSLVVGGENGLAEITNLQSPSALPILLKSKSEDVYTAAFDNTGKHIATAGLDGTVHVWSSNGALEKSLPCKQSAIPKAIYALSFDSTGTHLITAGQDGIRLWRISDCELTSYQRVGQRGVPSAVFALAYNPIISEIATAGLDGNIEIWSVQDERLIAEEAVVGHHQAVYALAFSPDGRRLASGSADKSTRIWTLNDRLWSRDYGLVDDAGKRVAVFDTFSVADPRAPSCGNGLDGPSDTAGTLSVWDVDTKRVAQQFRCPNFVAAAFSTDGRRIVSATSDSFTSFGLSGFRIWSWKEPYVYKLSISDDGRTIATLSPNRVKVWKEFHDEPLADWGGVDLTSIALNSDGTMLATGGLDGTVKIYSSKALIASLNTASHPIASLVFLNDPAIGPSPVALVSLSKDGVVMSWKLPSLEKLYSKKLGDFLDEEATNLRVSRAGRYIAVPTQKGAIVWDSTSVTEQPKVVGPPGPVRSIGFTAHNTLVSVGEDGRLRDILLDDRELLQAARNRLPRGFRDGECDDATPCSTFDNSFGHLALAQRFSRAGYIKLAIDEFEAAKTLDKDLKYNSATEAQTLRASTLIDAAKFELSRQNLDGVLDLIRSARGYQELDKSQTEWFTSHLIEFGQHTAKQAGSEILQKASQDDIRLAKKAYELAGQLDPHLFTAANPEAPSEMNNLCWFGTTAGHAKDVMEVCNAALNVSGRGNTAALDTHALASACSGDRRSAIEDYEDYLRLIPDDKSRALWLSLARDGKLCTSEFLSKQRAAF